MRRALPLAVVAGLLAVAGCGPEREPVRSLEPETLVDFLPGRRVKGELFDSYQAGGRSTWRNHWAGRLDFTGVAWNDPRTATLISPSHVVMAAHYPRPAEVPVVFHDRAGHAHERLIVDLRDLSPMADVAVAKLNEALPAEVKPYRLADPKMARLGRPVLVTDQTRAVSIHRIAGIAGGHLAMDYVPGLDSLYRRELIVGDSGNPGFLLDRGELFLLETHTTGGAGTGPFYGDPVLQGAIQAAIAEMGG
jgi:hypothetical protein